MKRNLEINSESLIDVHTHGMGIMMTHLLSGHYPYGQDIVDLAEKSMRNGVEYTITFPMPTSVYYNVSMLKHRHYEATGNCDFPFQYENLALVKSIKEFEINNILPFLAFSTQSCIEEQKNNIINLINEYEVYGLKYHASIERKSVLSGEFMEFANIAKENNIPILVHTKIDEWAHPKYLIEFAKKNPLIRVCAAHCGHFDREFINTVKNGNYNNLFVDCSPFVRICSDMLELNSADKMHYDYKNPQNAFKQLLADLPYQLLWGTDAPFNRFILKDGSVSNYFDEVAIIKNDMREKLSDNCKRFLFGMEGE